jgi:hypothetical protein
MRKVVLAVVLVLACGHTPQEGFTYGGVGHDWGASVAQLSDGGFVVAGATSSFGAGGEDFYLVRTNAAGDTLWTRTYGGAADDEGYSVQVTGDNGFIIAGTTHSFGVGSGDVWLVRTDGAGETLWTRTFGGPQDDRGASVVQAADGGFLVCGSTMSFGPYNYNVYLVKADSAGNLVWSRTYGGGNDDKGASVAQTSDAGFILAGFTYSFGAGDYDFYLVRTDGAGDTLWTRTYGGAASDQAAAVLQTPDHGFVVAGLTNSYGAGNSDAWLVRTDSAGDTLWTRTYGASGLDWSSSVAQMSDGGLVFCGATDGYGAGMLDAWLVRINAAGDTLWTRTFGGDQFDRGFAVRASGGGGYIVCGMTTSYGAGAEDMYLIKTGGNGDAEFVK